MTTQLRSSFEDEEKRHRIPPMLADLTIEAEDVYVDVEFSADARRTLVEAILKSVTWMRQDVLDVQTLEPEQYEDALTRIMQQASVTNALQLRLDPMDAKILAATLDAADYEPKECIVTGCPNLALPLEEWCNEHLRERH